MKILPNIAQEKALNALDYNRNGKSLVVLPSGIGKTYLAAFDTLKTKPKRILYVVHRNEILEQASKAFMKIHNLTENEIGFINKDKKQYHKKVVFSTIQTLSRTKNLKKISPYFYDYIILDEYHHVAAKTYKRILKYLRPKFLLGLTATPFRLDGKDIFKFVDENVAFEMNLEEGIRTKLLVPFIYYGFWDNIDYSDIKWMGFKYRERDLNKKLLIEERDRKIIKEYKKYIKNKQTIGFCVSVKHVKRMVRLFNRNNIPSAPIHHETPYIYRRKIIEDFRNKKYQVIFARDIFNEGVDFPEVEALLFLRPTLSKVVFLQQLGRGLRTSEGKRNVLVLDFIGNYINAYKIKEWIKFFTKGLNTRPPKPEYHYNIPQVWFHHKVIDLFEYQESRNITKEKLIQEYWRMKKLLGRRPIYTDFCYVGHKSIYSAKAYENYFGSWSNFLKHIGEWEEIKTKDLVDNYWKVKKKIRRIPKFSEMKKPLSKFSYSLYRKYFGGWIKFLKYLGEDKKAKRFPFITKKKLIKNYFNVKKKLRKQPIRDDIKNKKISLYGINAYVNRWGNWRNFLRYIKEPIQVHEPYKKDELILMYKKLAEKLKKNPSSIDCKKEFKSVMVPIERHFGSWLNFVKFMGDIPNVRKCVNCKKEFKIEGNKKKFCSKKCRSDYWNKK